MNTFRKCNMKLDATFYLCLFVVFIGLSGVYGLCPLPFEALSSSSSCYYFGSATTRTWDEARLRCLSMDSQLLKIEDAEEQTMLMNEFLKRDEELPGVQEWWVGMKRKEDNVNQWVWTDSSPVNESYIRWGQDEPNNYNQNEHCAEIWERTFNDKNCDSKLNFVCERPKDKPVRCSIQDGYSYHNRRCYKFVKNQLSRNQALLACANENARLVNVESEEDQHAVSEIAYSNKLNVWMGVQFINSSSQWLLTTTPGWEEPPKIFFWQTTLRASSINNPDYYCAALNASSEDSTNNWYIENCDLTNAFICQKPAGICPSGFEQREEKCYLFKINSIQPWSQAKLFCEQFQSNLLEIESDDELNFVTGKLQQRINPRLWIGLKGRKTKTQFQNGSLSQNVNDYYWEMSDGIRTPTYLQVGITGSGSACGYIDSGRSGKWYFDLLCSTRLPFICYQDVQNGHVTPRQFTTITTAEPPPVTTTAQALVPILTPAGEITTKQPTTTMPSTTTEDIFDPVCGYNWEREERSQVCYLFNRHPSTWPAARRLCQSVGGDLLSINNLREHYYIAGRLKEKSLSNVGMFWIGGYDERDEGGWEWSDGSPFSFFNFKRGEPTGRSGDENCITISGHRALWSNDYCSSVHASICKKKVRNDTVNIPATSPPFPSGDQVYGCPGEEWAGYRLSCYFVARNKTTWSEAQSYCKAAGGELASILDEGEQAFIYSLLPKTHCYNLYTSDKNCDLWAAAGECSKNPLWMANNCKQSCQMCVSDCLDTHGSTECQHWAKAGECQKNHRWMLPNCALSCGICDSAIYGGFWIGLHDKKDEMAFEWSDGMRVSFTTWADREPNNMGRDGQDCVMMKLVDGRWGDFNCIEKMPGFVCKTSKKLVPKATVSPLSIGCTNGSVGYNAFCYGIFETNTSWSDAEHFCGNRSGHLATVNSRYVQAFISSLIVGKKGNFWIGLTQSYDTGITEFWNSGQDVRFTYWGSDHTGSIEEDGFCVSMSANHPVGLWSTLNCSTLNSFICEFPREGFTTPSTTQPTTTLPKPCETGWKEHQGNCYKAMLPPESWMRARDTCRTMGAELASIHTYEENQFIFANFVEYNEKCWIGLNDRDLEEGFSWSDGSAVDYSTWADNEPNDFYSNEDCVAYLNIWSSDWNDENCYVLHPYICKIPKGVPVLDVANFTLPALPVPCADDRFVYIHGLCYYYERISTPLQTWYQSLDFCNNLNASLVTFSSQYQHDLISYYLHKNFEDLESYWIGLNDLEQMGWRWVDGTKVVSFVAWEQGEPEDTPTKRCVYQWTNSNRWYTTNCNAKLTNGVVCMKQNGSSEVITTPSTPMQPWGCPPEYIESRVNNKCYKIVQDDALSFNEAKEICSKHGRDYSLVSIHSEIENAFIALQFDASSTESLWIGLSDESLDSSFSWIDNSPVDFTNWNVGEPNSYAENCGEIIVKSDGVGKWNDVYCSVRRGYICQTQKAFRYPTQASAISKCPSGYNEVAGSCFRVIETAMDFNGAQATCQVDGANLASISSQYEQMSIEIETKDITGAIWIGLKLENTFIWLDKWPYTFSNWAPNEPSFNEGENCTVLLQSEWKDTRCDLKYPAICEYNTGTPPTTPPPGQCPQDTSKFAGFCFYVDPSAKIGWSKAKEMCSGKGMTLITFRNLNEVEFVRQLVISRGGNSRTRLWLGLRRTKSVVEDDYYNYYEETSETFNWIDGTDNPFENWNSGEPSGSWGHETENCAEMLDTGKFNDVNCDNYLKAYGCYTPESFDTTAATEGLSSTISWESPPLPTTSGNGFSDTTAVLGVTTSSPAANAHNSTKQSGIPDRPHKLPRRKFYLERTESESLSAGQIVGILIGTITLLIILIVILLVIRRHFRKGSYFTRDEHGFTNAMYLKTVESVSVSDDGAEKRNT
ncbi:macrophage mannose receptor 1-like isoform X2 [Crassostrea virginica]